MWRRLKLNKDDTCISPYYARIKELEQQIKELQEMCKECDIKYEELWASNWKLKAVIDEINLGIDKILDMNQEDYNFYTKQELRNIKEILKKVESKV